MIALPISGMADPVEVGEESERTKDHAACATWVEPEGDEFAWTDVCGYANDLDGDGTVDQRGGIVRRSICGKDGSSAGSFCRADETLAEGAVTAEEFRFDIAAGTASLHADLGSCRVDVDWTATGDLEAHEDPGAPRLTYQVAPPAASVSKSQRNAYLETREASIAADVCPAAGVSGEPAFAGLLTYEVATDSTTIAVDPTG